MIQFLQITVSLLFFTNKLLVLLGKRAGWIIGALSTILAFFYFLKLERYVFVTLQVGLLILMLYGFFPKRNKRIELWIRILISLVMLVIGYHVFTGFLTLVEFGSSIGLVIGTYFLANKKFSIGWFVSIIAHILAAILGYTVGQQFFADLQVASAIIATTGFIIALRSAEK